MVDPSSIAFWGILGGLTVLCVGVIVLVYFTCYSRNPRNCLPTENEELLETTIQREEIHTVSSETHMNGKHCNEPTFVHKSEQLCRVTTRQQCRTNTLKTPDPVKIQVTSQSNKHKNICIKTNSSSPCSGTGHSAQLNGIRLDTGSNTSTPRSGQTHITSIGVGT
ncbi:hypothetical protein ACF0H5_014998 [Mactra antiquata]